MLSQVVFCLLVFYCSSTAAKYSKRESKELFENFVQEHGKVYANEQEKESRFQIFLHNLNEVERLNKNLKHPVYGITKFMDFTTEEFLGTHTGLKVGGPEDWCQPGNFSADSAPASFDWRVHNAVTGVKDQGPCGSCYAFSTAGDIEGKYAIKHQELISLSTQEIVDCDRNAFGCKGGWLNGAYRSLIDMGGIEADADYPYNANDNSCAFDKVKVKVVVTDCAAYQLQSQEKLKQLLHQKGPLSIAVDATLLQMYKSGVIGKECWTGGLNHGVLLVGYGTDPSQGDYWVVKNSWGNWGEKGYFRMERGEGKSSCGVLKEPIYTPTVD